ncbi:MAG: hypothetical protein QNJ78_16220, partial [Gammaproteobacteria bacterium]|nr:hypothetical protein [Gammaproteobacteria bacterium]
MQHKEAGFSLLEWALVTIVTGILIFFLLTRILDLLVDAERVNLSQWEAKLKNALSHEMSRLVIGREFEQLARMDGMNPIGLLPERPERYLGESVNPRLADLPPGAWIYDSFRKVLIYTINHPAHFQSTLAGR